MCAGTQDVKGKRKVLGAFRALTIKRVCRALALSLVHTRLVLNMDKRDVVKYVECLQSCHTDCFNAGNGL